MGGLTVFPSSGEVTLRVSYGDGQFNLVHMSMGETEMLIQHLIRAVRTVPPTTMEGLKASLGVGIGCG